MKSSNVSQRNRGRGKIAYRTIATFVAMSVATLVPASLAGASGTSVDSIEASCPTMKTATGTYLMHVCEAPPCTQSGNYNMTIYGDDVNNATGRSDVANFFATDWIDVTDPNDVSTTEGLDLVDAAEVQLVPTTNSNFHADYARFIAACAAQTGAVAVGILVTDYGYNYDQADHAVTTDKNWAESTDAFEAFLDITDGWLGVLPG